MFRELTGFPSPIASIVLEFLPPAFNAPMGRTLFEQGQVYRKCDLFSLLAEELEADNVTYLEWFVQAFTISEKAGQQFRLLSLEGDEYLMNGSSNQNPSSDKKLIEDFRAGVRFYLRVHGNWNSEPEVRVVWRLNPMNNLGDAVVRDTDVLMSTVCRIDVGDRSMDRRLVLVFHSLKASTLDACRWLCKFLSERGGPMEKTFFKPPGKKSDRLRVTRDFFLKVKGMPSIAGPSFEHKRDLLVLMAKAGYVEGIAACSDDIKIMLNKYQMVVSLGTYGIECARPFIRSLKRIHECEDLIPRIIGNPRYSDELVSSLADLSEISPGTLIDGGRSVPILKELEAKEWPFPDEDIGKCLIRSLTRMWTKGKEIITNRLLDIMEENYSKEGDLRSHASKKVKIEDTYHPVDMIRVPLHYLKSVVDRLIRIGFMYKNLIFYLIIGCCRHRLYADDLPHYVSLVPERDDILKLFLCRSETRDCNREDFIWLFSLAGMERSLQTLSVTAGRREDDRREEWKALDVLLDLPTTRALAISTVKEGLVDQEPKDVKRRCLTFISITRECPAIFLLSEPAKMLECWREIAHRVVGRGEEKDNGSEAMFLLVAERELTSLKRVSWDNLCRSELAGVLEEVKAISLEMGLFKSLHSANHWAMFFDRLLKPKTEEGMSLRKRYLEETQS